jgi:hypothetical protein
MKTRGRKQQQVCNPHTTNIAVCLHLYLQLQLFLLRHITHSAADAETKQKAAEEEASKRAAAEAAAGL